MEITTQAEELRSLGERIEDVSGRLQMAAQQIVDLIEETVPFDCVLPRGYEVIMRPAGNDDRDGERYPYLRFPSGGFVDETLPYDEYGSVKSCTQDDLLQFSKDIAEGLLGEIIDELRKRTNALAEANARLSPAEQNISGLVCVHAVDDCYVGELESRDGDEVVLRNAQVVIEWRLYSAPVVEGEPIRQCKLTLASDKNGKLIEPMRADGVGPVDKMSCRAE